MSSTRRLNLAPLPNTENVKLTFTSPASLEADLDCYTDTEQRKEIRKRHPSHHYTLLNLRLDREGRVQEKAQQFVDFPIFPYYFISPKWISYG